MTQPTITDADREAAANLWLEFQGSPHSAHDQRVADEFRNGDRDDDEFVHAITQARQEGRIEGATAMHEEARRLIRVMDSSIAALDPKEVVKP